MPTALPVEIGVTESPDGAVTYDFPRRELGPWRWVGVLLILGGVMAIGFLSIWTIGFAGGLMQAFGLWGALAGLFALPFLFGTFTLIAVGLAVIIGRARLRVTDRHLIVVEQLGWFPWRRRVARNRISRLIVQAGKLLKVGDTVESTPLTTHFAALMAEMRTGKPQALVLGYPRDLLVPVAHDLSARLAIDSPSENVQTVPVPVTVIDSTTEDNGEFERLEQPASSLIDLQELEDGCIFTIPAPGVWKGSAGLFVFSLIWCGFMTLFSSFALFAPFKGENGEQAEWWMVALFISLFWAVGIGMLLAAINMGKRQAAIAIADGQMKTIVSGLFGIARKEWELADLQTVRKGPSGMEVNDVPVMQLHIVPHNGKPYGLLTGRDDAELEWIATHLRRFVKPLTEVSSAEM